MPLDAPTRPGTDHLDRLVAYFRRSTIAQSFGIEFRYDKEQRAIFELPYDGRFDHFLDDVHGGTIATLIDNAGWFTAAAHYPTWIVSVEFSVRLHEPARRETLRAMGRIVRAGRRFTSTEMTVHNASGALVATGAGTFAVTQKELPE